MVKIRYDAPAGEFRSRAARDAKQANYGPPSYWKYLDDHAVEMAGKYVAADRPDLAINVLERTLGEALFGNEGA